jgi:hypothetical protein
VTDIVVKEKIPWNLNELTLSEIEERGLTHLLNRKKPVDLHKIKDVRFKGLPRKTSVKPSIGVKSWYSIGYWHKKLEREWSKLQPNQRAHYSVELIKMLVSKLNQMPVDPHDSVLNANDALQMLRDLEKKPDNVKAIQAQSAIEGIANKVAQAVVEEPLSVNSNKQAESSSPASAEAAAPVGIPNAPS